jgi:hypothetical protein
MAYSTSNPPALTFQTIGGGTQHWTYATTDTAATVDTANYFTNAAALGMAAGSSVRVLKSDASPKSVQNMTVNTVASTGADLTDGSAVTSTNTD